MTDERDPLLQSLFVDAQRELSPEAFTAEVMARTRFVRYRIFLPLAGAGLVLALCAWYLAIPLELAQLVAQVLTATLIDLGDTWLAWLLSPVRPPPFFASFLIFLSAPLPVFSRMWNLWNSSR